MTGPVARLDHLARDGRGDSEQYNDTGREHSSCQRLRCPVVRIDLAHRTLLELRIPPPAREHAPKADYQAMGLSMNLSQRSLLCSYPARPEASEF